MMRSNREAGTAAQPSRRPDRAETLRDFVMFLAGCERRLGPSQALLRFGLGMDISCDIPDWMPKGNLGECHAAALLALVAAQARGRTDLRYTEGYAIERTGLPLAIQHAWLSDGEGRVLDPTWLTTASISTSACGSKRASCSIPWMRRSFSLACSSTRT